MALATDIASINPNKEMIAATGGTAGNAAAPTADERPDYAGVVYYSEADDCYYAAWWAMNGSNDVFPYIMKSSEAPLTGTTTWSEEYDGRNETEFPVDSGGDGAQDEWLQVTYDPIADVIIFAGVVEDSGGTDTFTTVEYDVGSGTATVTDHGTFADDAVNRIFCGFGLSTFLDNESGKIAVYSIFQYVDSSADRWVGYRNVYENDFGGQQGPVVGFIPLGG